MGMSCHCTGAGAQTFDAGGKSQFARPHTGALTRESDRDMIVLAAEVFS
jgi:hypothetical protein